VQDVYFELASRVIAIPKWLHFVIGLVALLPVKDIETSASVNAHAAIVDEVEEVHGYEWSDARPNVSSALKYG
jgi:ABC-type methionine transport system permease subunit